MIYDPTLQQKLLTALLKYPQEWLSIKSFFSENDVVDEDYKDSMVLSLVRQAIEKGEDVDANIIAQRLERMNLKVDTDLSLPEYVISLSKRNCQEGLVLKFAKELKKLALRRELALTGEELTQRMESLDQSSSYTEILEAADSIYNKKVNHFELDGDVPRNIFENMESVIEERGNNPITDFGLLGPYEMVNKIYGSLVRPGNISVIVARAKVGKTTLALDYNTFITDKHNVPILHFDNGEMSEEELIFRQAAALSGVPLYLLETGQWRNTNEEIVRKVRETLQRVKRLRFYYYCVGGMPVDEMINVAKRFYYDTVGRGNQMVISFDYIKPISQSDGTPEWQFLGELVDKFKRLIQKEILFENKPMVSLFTSVQSNRGGIVSNKKGSNAVVDDESIVGGSDRIIQYCSHLAILRKKTSDEIIQDGDKFGTHKLIFRAARHLGKDVKGHLEPVKCGDRLEDNFINLKIDNFKIEERGDLRDIMQSKNTNAKLHTQQNDDQPDF